MEHVAPGAIPRDASQSTWSRARSSIAKHAVTPAAPLVTIDAPHARRYAPHVGDQCEGPSGKCTSGHGAPVDWSRRSFAPAVLRVIGAPSGAGLKSRTRDASGGRGAPRSSSDARARGSAK